MLSFTIISGIVFNDVYSMYWLSRLLIQRDTGQETEYLADLFEHRITLLTGCTKKEIKSHRFVNILVFLRLNNLDLIFSYHKSTIFV